LKLDGKRMAVTYETVTDYAKLPSFRIFLTTSAVRPYSLYKYNKITAIFLHANTSGTTVYR